MCEQRKWFLETESTGEDAVKIVEMITKDLEYYIKLIKQWQCLREVTPILDSNFEKCSDAVKWHCMLQRNHS